MSSTRRRSEGRQLAGGSSAADRRHSHEQRALGSALAGFLVTLPDFDEVARLVVALLKSPLAASGVVIVGNPDGSPVVLGSCPAALRDSFTSEPDPEAGPMTAAMTEALAGRPVFPPEGDASQDIASRVAAWPLGAGRQSIGALILLLERPVDAARVQSCVSELADVITLYLAGALQGPLDPPDCPGDGQRTDGPPQFTPRQQDVLHLLERGMTMRQIASRIGFSDSTVRAESLAIYRGLGVHDRESAIAAARELGLLDGRLVDGERAQRHADAPTMPRELELAGSGGSAA